MIQFGTVTTPAGVAMPYRLRAIAQGVRQLMGPTAFEKAVPGTIRGDYAASTTRNLIHGSDSPEAARQEILRFFGPEGLA